MLKHPLIKSPLSNSLKQKYGILKQEIKRLNQYPTPVKVLEWGSGLSTMILCETLKEDSIIVSIEHDTKYRFNIPKPYQKKLTQIILTAQKPFGQSDNYVTAPITNFIKTGSGFDLIIIDGRNRADCLAVAAMLLNPEGSVILCDAERKHYQSHFSLFQKIYIHPEPDSCYQTALLQNPICSFRSTGPLNTDKPETILPKRNPVPCTWGVCAVAIPRESYYWLRDWIEHHIKAGASKIAIYNNTGSMKSLRSSSPFIGGKFQQKQISKRKEEYGRLTDHLSDEQIDKELKDIATSYNGVVEIIDWKPKHPKENMIVHGQVEAYCDFIRRHRETLGWGFFIDMDEYIYCRPGLNVNRILEFVEQQYPSVSALHLTDWEFECRWGNEGPKDISKHLIHHPRKHSCGKIMARLQDITHANVHWDWHLKDLCSRLRVHGNDMAFAHYMQLPEDLENGANHILPRAFLDTPVDLSIEPQFISSFHIDNCGVPALPVDTTFVEMYQETSL